MVRLVGPRQPWDRTQGHTSEDSFTGNGEIRDSQDRWDVSERRVLLLHPHLEYFGSH